MKLNAPQRLKRLGIKQMLKEHGDMPKSTFWRHIKQGLIPKPRYLKPRHPFWLLGDLEDHYGQCPSGAKKTESRNPDERTREQKKEKSPSVVNQLRRKLGL